MTSMTSDFDQGFIDRQRLRLLGDRQNLLEAIEAGRAENSGLAEAAAGGAREMEDSAQDLTLGDENRDLGARLEVRLVSIDRALSRIAAGTYGISETTGDRLPRTRLEALPEACSEAE